MSSRFINWFVLPEDAHTNEVIARFVGEGDFQEGASELRCGDGKMRKLWRALSNDIRLLWNSRNTLGLHFKVFNQAGQGKIRDVTFLFK